MCYVTGGVKTEHKRINRRRSEEADFKATLSILYAWNKESLVWILKNKFKIADLSSNSADDAEVKSREKNGEWKWNFPAESLFHAGVSSLAHSVSSEKRDTWWPSSSVHVPQQKHCYSPPSLHTPFHTRCPVYWLWVRSQLILLVHLISFIWFNLRSGCM